MSAAIWPLSRRIGSVPAVAVYLMSRPSTRTVCVVSEIFSSFSPAVSTRGVESVAGAAGCGAAPRPCAAAGAAPANRAKMRAIVHSFMSIVPRADDTTSLLFVWRSAARLRDVLLLDAIDVELRRARNDLVQRFVVIERRRF